MNKTRYILCFFTLLIIGLLLTACVSVSFEEEVANKVKDGDINSLMEMANDPKTNPEELNLIKKGLADLYKERPESFREYISDWNIRHLNSPDDSNNAILLEVLLHIGTEKSIREAISYQRWPESEEQIEKAYVPIFNAIAQSDEKLYADFVVFMRMIKLLKEPNFEDELNIAKYKIINREAKKIFQEHGEVDGFVQFGIKHDYDCSEMLSIIGAQAVEPIVEAYLSANMYSEIGSVRDQATNLRYCMQEMERIQDPAAAEPLWKLINEDPELSQPYHYESTGFATRHDQIYETQGYIIRALGNLGDQRIEGILIESLRSEEYSQAVEAGDILAKLYNNDVNRLLLLLNNADTYRIFRAIVKIGDPATVDPLIVALDRYNDKTMAEILLNCGNPDLKSAAKKWADQHGYEITSNSTNFAPSGWGSGNK